MFYNKALTLSKKSLKINDSLFLNNYVAKNNKPLTMSFKHIDSDMLL